MAVVRVTRTRDGAGAIDYGQRGSAHVHDENVNERVLVASGLNVSVDHAKQQMQSVWQHYGTQTRNQVEAYRVIQSFSPDELDYRNPDDCQKANDLGYQTAEKLFPDRQVLVLTQADGKGHKLHNHILVNSLNPVTGKALRGSEKDFQTIADASDDVLRDNGMTPLEGAKTPWNAVPQAERALIDKGAYSWRDDLKNRIVQGMDDTQVVDEATMIQKMSQLGVDVRFRGQNGVSYAFTDNDGKKRVSRGKRLGEMFEKGSLEDGFESNKAGQFDVRAIRTDEQKHATIKRQSRPVEQDRPTVVRVDVNALEETRRRVQKERAEQRAIAEAKRLSHASQQTKRVAQKQSNRPQQPRRSRQNDGPSIG